MMADQSKLPGKYVKLKCEQAEGLRIDNPLFGLDTVERVTKTGRIIFSEGVLDATTLIQIEESTIASCGGRFSREHRREVLNILRRLKKKRQDLRIIIWFDHDPVSQTGQRSAMELGQFLLQNGVTSHIVTFGGSVKIDINSLFLQSGEPAIRQALDQAKAYIDIRIEEIKEAAKDCELQHGIGKKLIAELVQGGFPVSLVKTFFNGVLPVGIVSEMIRDSRNDIDREKTAEDPRPAVPLPGELCELQKTANLLGATYGGQEQLLAKVFNHGNTTNKVKRKKQTPGDKARACSAIITPMFVFGGLLPGRSPVFMVEADQSQTGKGYLVKMVTAFYRDIPAVVSQRSGRGIGSLQESFDAALIAGRPFVSFDNLRGKLNEQGVESFLTESNYSARIPYVPPVSIDTLKTIIFMTSNGVELTRDQANRCCVIRIRKRPQGYPYRKYPEGDIIDHIRANQPKFLGAVYTIIKNYVEAK
ncbi:MAG: hypothetical protein NT118_16145 [Lentisphaerae bacterium]|nr:hypothetical protein [Lentisphaerota bacterium]